MEALDRFEESTLICAVIHYALHVADPSECVRILEKVAPITQHAPWEQFVAEARKTHRGIFDAVDPLLGAETDNLVGSAPERER